MQHIIRTLLIAAGIASIHQQSQAQDKTEGKIHYDVVYNVHASLKPDQLQYRDLIPETVTEKAELIYKGQRLKVYFNDEVQRDEEGVSSRIKIATDDGNEKYADADKGTLLWVDREKTPPVLIEKALFDPNADFKEAEGAETRKVLDYTCKKLMLKTKEGSYTLWYTTELPLKTGTALSTFTNKGVVLALESKRINFEATSIEFVPVSEKEVTPPSDLQIVKNTDNKAK